MKTKIAIEMEIETDDADAVATLINDMLDAGSVQVLINEAMDDRGLGVIESALCKEI
jgi:hypothetical protein